MNEVARPQVGDWYRRLGKGEPFRVVDFDEASGDVEIQAFDGALDSIGAEEWAQLALEPAAAPADWTGALEDVESDDVTEDDLPSDRGSAM